MMNEIKAAALLQEELDKRMDEINDDVIDAYILAIQRLRDITSGDVIVMGRDYWLDCYKFYHASWKADDDDFSKENFRESFQIQRRK